MTRTILSAAAAIACAATADTLTLEDCQARARERHPLARQKSYIEHSRDYTLENALRGWLPQLAISGKATDQSDPAMRGLETDQSQIALEISQTLWDGGNAAARRRNARASALVDAARVESDLHALRSRVDQIFFGILSIDEQLVQNALLARDLETNLARVKAYEDNGVANQSDVDMLRVELLRTGQRRTELRSTQDAFRAMMSLLVGGKVDSATKLVRPVPSIPVAIPSNRRPELELFRAQEELATTQEDAVKARVAPRVGAFLQLGEGKPGLSLANREYTSFWVAGLRLSWDLGAIWTWENDRALIALQRETVASRRDAFRLDVDLETARGMREIAKYRSLIEQDDGIIALRSRIRAAAEAKVEAGTMSVADLVREMNAEAFSRQERILHEMQLLLAVATLEATTNDGTSP